MAIVKRAYDTRDREIVGRDADSAQPCSGDSGGPLLKDGKVYGVASGVLRTNKLVCDYGAVYATLGPDVMEFLKEARRNPRQVPRKKS